MVVMGTEELSIMNDRIRKESNLTILTKSPQKFNVFGIIAVGGPGSSDVAVEALRRIEDNFMALASRVQTRLSLETCIGIFDITFKCKKDNKINKL